MRTILTAFVFGILLFEAQAQAQAQAQSIALCSSSDMTVYTDFEGGVAADCQVVGKRAVVLQVAPENEPINNSPWYAFRVVSESLERVDVKIEYDGGTHRYTPKLSSDAAVWVEYPKEQLIVPEDKSSVAFTVPLKGGETWVAAQPLLGIAEYQAWWEPKVEQDQLELAEVGSSIEERPLYRLTYISDQKELLLVLGRQHPPETTGAVAMMAFIDRLLSGDALSARFLERVGLVVYPFINRDGVARGHWRHNVGGKDLNRDWGPFEQPEPRLINADFEALVSQHNVKLGYMLDFHSTWYDVFYTQRDSDFSRRADFTREWLGSFESSMQELEPEFTLNRKSSHNRESPTSKTYFFERYGIPATTYEIGDEGSLDRIREYARRSAETFMRTWLAEGEWYE